MLRVSDAGENTVKQLVGRAVSGDEERFARLRELLIRPELLENATEDLEPPSSMTDFQAEPRHGDIAARTWTDEVLTRAEKLTVLAACMDTAPLVNHLQHLKHLVLCCQDFHAATAVLPQAHSLETLCLGTLRRQHLEIDWSYSFPSVDYQHEPLEIPCVMLEALPLLRAVALRDLRPKQLRLPAGCELHLSGDSSAIGGCIVCHCDRHACSLYTSPRKPWPIACFDWLLLSASRNGSIKAPWLDPWLCAATAYCHQQSGNFHI